MQHSAIATSKEINQQERLQDSRDSIKDDARYQQALCELVWGCKPTCYHDAGLHTAAQYLIDGEIVENRIHLQQHTRKTNLSHLSVTISAIVSTCSKRIGEELMTSDASSRDHRIVLAIAYWLASASRDTLRGLLQMVSALRVSSGHIYACLHDTSESIQSISQEICASSYVCTKPHLLCKDIHCCKGNDNEGTKEQVMHHQEDVRPAHFKANWQRSYIRDVQSMHSLYVA